MATSTPSTTASAPLPGWPGTESPYHAGEQAVQERAGVRERAERAGRRVIRDFMPDQHRELFGKLPYVIAGSLDHGDRPWASILTGEPGFMRTPDARTLEVSARVPQGDPLAANLAPGAPLGILGIELATRRRNRMNGTVIRTGADGFAVSVRQSFGNCPRYIQARRHQFVAVPGAGGIHAVRGEGRLLSDLAVTLIRSADTFFIASASPAARGGDPAEGVDVSHRGGKPGFVRVTVANGQSLLTAPDFVGNSAFNTFGNLALNPRAGLLFVDFAAGHTLALTGSTEIVWEGAELGAFDGAQRLLRFRSEEGLWIENGCPLRWSDADPAPQLAATGAWPETHER